MLNSWLLELTRLLNKSSKCCRCANNRLSKYRHCASNVGLYSVLLLLDFIYYWLTRPHLSFWFDWNCISVRLFHNRSNYFHQFHWIGMHRRSPEMWKRRKKIERKNTGQMKLCVQNDIKAITVNIYIELTDSSNTSW